MFTDMYGNARYKIGLHIHTTLSDGKVSPEEAARIYKEAGFDAIAITDHWKFHGADTLSGLPILSGCEYNLGASDTSVDVMHIVGVGMETVPQLTKDTASRQDVIDAINQNGGIAILAHPAWSLNTPEHALALSGFAATEIYNTVSNVNQSSRPYSGYFVDLLANKGTAYPLIATDDTHYYNGEDNTKSYIMVKAESLTRENILNAVKNGDFYATQGPELHIRREEDKLIADCSPCVMIDFLSNAAWGPDRITRGENLTHAEYRIKPHDKWVRVEVHDENGNYAWSNVLML
ncbi:MAG: CehA/McbA family metallohydrolase [Clostridia bacterium]|nr:CehA/McbA family metallohydrolase [Clostridia bacterium]